MSAKTSPARIAAFFAALRATGNQAIACERAKVSRSWVTLHCSTDPAFKAEIAAAVAEAKAHFEGLGASGEGTRAPPSGWGSIGGEELVVKGTGGSGGGKRVQIARARLKQWTPRLEDRFLEMLAATCNVKLACAEVGMTAQSAYLHRKRWPRFAARWDAAIAMGYERIDLAMARAAAGLFDPPEHPAEAIIAPVSVDDAIRLVRLHERRAREARRRWDHDD